MKNKDSDFTSKDHGDSGLVQILKRDQRPQCYAWAPGACGHTCSECDEKFLGDKRASMCAPCAYGDCL